MTISNKGLALIKEFEQLRLTAYLPTPTDHWTVGWGHCGKDVHDGLVITESHAEELLQHDTDSVMLCLSRYVNVPTTQNQIDALCCLVFNVGTSSFIRSHLLTAINSGNMESARTNWLDWDHQGGVVLAGLKRRRETEWSLFTTPTAV